MADTIRFGPDLAVAWEDYKQGINDAVVPAGTYLIRNPAGNLALINAAGDYLGFIDTMDAHVEVFGGGDADA